LGRVGVGEVCTARRILSFLADGRPRSCREVADGVGAGLKSVENRLFELWRGGLVLGSEGLVMVPFSVFHGRSGVWSGRSFHRFYLRSMGGGEVPVVVDGMRFVGYSKRVGPSKCGLVLDFLRRHRDRAFYTMDVYGALGEVLKRKSAVMDSVRYYERKGLIYVRGYRGGEDQTPFQHGFIVTFIDQDEPRDVAVKEAVERTERLLTGSESGSNRLNERIRHIRDIVLASTHLNELTSYNYLRRQVGCTEHELEYALGRMNQIYPDIKVVKLFGAYRFYYHSSMSEGALKAALESKINYVRKTKGRAHRIGHNWEATVEWFVDRLIENATFWEQKHRGGGRMDPRRITLYLVRSVGDRRNRAEVDRVWAIRNQLMRKPTTYVLSCKWGLVRKRDLDDFLEVLKWSKEFGVDAKDGREVKKNVIGVFAAGAFNPKERVQLQGGGEVTLPSYAERLSIDIIKASDLNSKLRERGVEKKEVTVQKICRAASNEVEVRELLDEIWNGPKKAEEILEEAAARNQEIYQLERTLEEKGLDINMIITHEGLEEKSKPAIQPQIEEPNRKQTIPQTINP